MPPQRPITTLKVCRRVMQHILSKAAYPEESVDTTLRRLLRIGKPVPKKARRGFSAMKTIKVSREVMNHILEKALPKESRDQTLGRLLGVAGDDGNVRTDE